VGSDQNGAGAFEDAAGVASLDQPATPDGTTALGDLIDTGAESFEQDVERQLIVERVRKLVSELDQLEQDVLRLRYGLDGQEPASLHATAKQLGIGVRRARQAETRALKRLAEDPALREALAAA